MQTEFIFQWYAFWGEGGIEVEDGPAISEQSTTLLDPLDGQRG
jgi:hypothetical protein